MLALNAPVIRITGACLSGTQTGQCPAFQVSLGRVPILIEKQDPRGKSLSHGLAGWTVQLIDTHGMPGYGTSIRAVVRK